MLWFETIDLTKERTRVIEFRKDSFKESFGNSSDFDEHDYLIWLQEQVKNFPDGFVMVEERGKTIGQLELSIRSFQGKDIGYVHLFYLIPEKRGLGLGKELYAYANEFFNNNNVEEFHLRVSPTNVRALHFYQKNGMVEAGTEVNGKVIRMKGSLYKNDLKNF
ncbi:MAG TPA: GNAT family N-acetyltransferase [Bacillus sp. (in: firmicutes)]|nr:GNAT family N-acetyltransferase [Bacillus litorisediminis]HWO74626.1 GNAT family N-acetyltransferase [Bacillus sp. (in: firmicutes)]